MFKRKKIATTAKVLVDATEGLLDSVIQSTESTDQLLTRLGVSRQQAFDAITADDEVESCREDLRMAMLSKTWRLWGEDASDDDVNRLWKTVRKQLPHLVEAVLTAKINGFAVVRYLYEPEADGFLNIVKISDKRGELDKYLPRADGALVYNSDNGEQVVDTQVLYSLITSQATPQNPAGEMAGARLYPAVAIRKQGFVYAAQFIKRYAQPYMIGHIEGETDGFVSKLYSFLSGGAIAISREDKIEMLQNSADGQAFQRLERMANARIQKALLGKVKTSDLENGSRAAQETEETTKGDRIDGYLYMLTLAVQHMIDALLLVNMAYGKSLNAPKGLWFEFNKESEIDVKRAERDAKYCEAAGLQLTKDYFIDVLGLEESHFTLAESKAVQAQLSAKLSNPKPEPVVNHLPLNVFTKPKIDALLSALEASDSYAEFESKLGALDLSQGDAAIIQRVLGDGVHEWVKGSEANNG